MAKWTLANSVVVLVGISVASAAVINCPIKIDNTYSYVEAHIGTPPKTYRLMFDTGSGSSWITSEYCQNSGQCPNLTPYPHVGYNSNFSSTYQYKGPYNEIPYIDGDGVAGASVQDEFTWDSGNGSPTNWNQSFMSVDVSSWSSLPADGFMGMSFSSIAETNTTTIVETLMQQGLLDSPRVGIYYGTNGSNGVMTIGGSKEDIYVKDEVQWAPLRVEYPYQFWRTTFRSVIVLTNDNGAATNNTTTIPLRRRQQTTTPQVPGPINTTIPVTDGRIVFDTGAGRVSLPSDIIGPVYAALGWNLTDLLHGRARFECKDHNDTWAVNFVIGQGEDTSNDVVYQIRGDELKRDENCMPPFDDSGIVGFGLFGSAFISRFYTVLDYGSMNVDSYKPRIGFGRLKTEYDPKYL